MALFSNYIPFKADLDKYLLNCKKVFAEIGDRQSAALVDGFMQDFENQRFCITIMGSLKRGKSTLLNTLMERTNDDISPIASEVCTSAIIKYLDKGVSKDTKERAVVHFEDSDKAAMTIPLARLRDYVTESRNPENRKGVRSVEVYGDFPAWSKAVAIVDSPGQNAVYDYHDALLQDFLPYSDALVFLIAADMPIDGGDLKLLAELVNDEQKKKIFFVITKADRADNDSDLDDVKDRVEQILGEVGLPFEKVYCTSAKPVFEKLRSGCTGDALDNLKSDHGILELEQDLESFIVRESDATKVFAERVRTILEMTASACSRYVDRSKVVLSRMQVDMGALQLQEAELTDQNEEFRRKMKESLKKFDRDWSKAVGQLKRKLTVKANVVADRLADQVGNGRDSFVGVISKSFTLKKMIQKALDAEVQPVVLDLESRLDDIVNTLSEECAQEVDFYFSKGRPKADASGGVLGMLGLGGVAGTAAWGVSSAAAPLLAAKTALSAWHGAQVAVAGAESAASCGSVGFFPWLGHLLFGGGKAAELAVAKSAEASATAAAIGTGISALVSVGTSLVITIVAEKILKMGLTKINGMRVSGVVEAALAEMEMRLCKSLEEYRKSITDAYSSNMEDLISDNTDKLEDIRKVMAKDDPAERERISKKLESVQTLLANCTHVQKQLSVM